MDFTDYVITDLQVSRFGHYLIFMSLQRSLCIERYTSLESMFAARQKQDYTDDKNYKKKYYGIRDMQRVKNELLADSRVFLSPHDDTLFISNKGSLWESNKSLKELLEDEKNSTIDLN
jgi:hypothetical protein